MIVTTQSFAIHSWEIILSRQRFHVFVVKSTLVILGHIYKECEGFFFNHRNCLKMAGDSLKGEKKDSYEHQQLSSAIRSVALYYQGYSTDQIKKTAQSIQIPLLGRSLLIFQVIYFDLGNKIKTCQKISILNTFKIARLAPPPSI